MNNDCKGMKSFEEKELKSGLLLAIESSCDDTSVAVMRGRRLLCQKTASQAVHEQYGGVVPEAASRAHLANIVPTVAVTLAEAGVKMEEIGAVAVTRGPGLMGSLLVGVSFAKGLAQGLRVPLIEVNHLQAHVMANFVEEEGVEKRCPEFPFLCLLVSGGNSQIVLVRGPGEMEIVGATIDDAAGEAMDKCARVMGLPYPGGPVVDKLAKEGDAGAFELARPRVGGLDFSFSGLKTSFLYLLRDKLKENENFIREREKDLCASLQRTVVDILLEKMEMAIAEHEEVKDVALAGGVSANSELRRRFEELAVRSGRRCHVPPLRFTTDNAAMVGAAAAWKADRKEFASLGMAPYARVRINEQ